MWLIMIGENKKDKSIWKIVHNSHLTTSIIVENGATVEKSVTPNNETLEEASSIR